MMEVGFSRKGDRLMREPEKTVEQIEKIKAELLHPAFELIKSYIISQRCGEPEIISTKETVALAFNDKRGKKCNYRCYINANGRVYRDVRRPPDTGNDFSGGDASQLTPGMILNDFKACFPLSI